MLAGPSLIRRANLRKGHAMRENPMLRPQRRASRLVAVHGRALPDDAF